MKDRRSGTDRRKAERRSGIPRPLFAADRRKGERRQGERRLV